MAKTQENYSAVSTHPPVHAQGKEGHWHHDGHE
jgi:hypothetical protein